MRLYAFPTANLADAANTESDIGLILPLPSLDMQEPIDNGRSPSYFCLVNWAWL